MYSRKPGQLITYAIAAIMLTACGKETPDERLVDAAEQVSSVEEQIDDVNEEISDSRSSLERRRAEVREAEQALAAARSELRKLQKQLAEEREELDSTASDTAIFRLLQTRLLEDEVLASEAINLFVLDRSVVLYGDVRSEEQKARAANIASDVPAVEEVRNFIEVSDSGDSDSDSDGASSS